MTRASSVLLMTLISLTFLLGGWPTVSFAAKKKEKEFIDSGALQKETVSELDSFYDPKADYTHFPGRVTDKDSAGMVFKVTSENKNTKFFKIGDVVDFYVAQHEKGEKCQGYIRNVEENFFSIYVKDIRPCWQNEEYFRRGTILSFTSDQLAQRVKDAAIQRAVLLRRKKDFMDQLNGLNHFVWSYDQKRIQVAAEFDKRIMEIEKEKQHDLENLLAKKNDSIRLQQELIFKLNGIDKDLDFYRVEKNELLIDRWNSDSDLGLPVGNRPQEFNSN